MFKKILVVVMALGVLPGAVAAQTHRTFDDVPNGHPNFEAIEMLANDGLITGYDDGTFRPGDLVNRAEMAALIVRGLGVDTAGYKDCFSDVREEWFAEYVCFGKNTTKRQWLSGYPGTTVFRPGNDVNFVESLRMVLDAYEIELIGTEKVAPYDQWYHPYTLTAVKIGAIDAPIGFDFGQKMTRGDVAEIIYRTRSYLNDMDSIEAGAEISPLSERSGEQLDFVIYNYDWNNEIGSLAVYRLDEKGFTNTRNIDLGSYYDVGVGYGASPRFQYFADKVYTSRMVVSDDWNEYLGSGEILETQILEIDPQTGEIRVVTSFDGSYRLAKWAVTRAGVLALMSKGAETNEMHQIDLDSGEKTVVMSGFDEINSVGETSDFLRTDTIQYSFLGVVGDTLDQFIYNHDSGIAVVNKVTKNVDGLQLNDICQTDTENLFVTYEYSDYFLDIVKLDLETSRSPSVYQRPAHEQQYVREMACGGGHMFAELSVLGQPENSWIMMDGLPDEEVIGKGTLIDASENYVIYTTETGAQAREDLMAYEIATGKTFKLDLQHEARYDNVYIQ